MAAGGGIPGLALANMLGPKAPHFPAKAKSVISIFCYGGVSQMDTFDPKPMLKLRAGETIPGKKIVPSQGSPGGLMPALWEFKKYGQSGMDVSTLFPHVAQKVDEIAFIRSMHCTSNDHGPALYQMNTGFIQAGYPSMGSWLTYGLGTENQNLPAFVVFTDPRGGPFGAVAFATDLLERAPIVFGFEGAEFVNRKDGGGSCNRGGLRGLVGEIEM